MTNQKFAEQNGAVDEQNINTEDFMEDQLEVTHLDDLTANNLSQESDYPLPDSLGGDVEDGGDEDTTELDNMPEEDLDEEAEEGDADISAIEADEDDDDDDDKDEDEDSTRPILL